MDRVIYTDSKNWNGPIARIAIALMVFPHGAQKLLGWFGGAGFDASIGFFTQLLGLPYIVALFVLLIEFFAPLFLVAGLFTRVAAMALAANFIGVITVDTIHNGWFMNWNRQAGQGEGLEFFILLFGLLLILLIYGGGRASWDSMLSFGKKSINNKNSFINNNKQSSYES